MAGMEDDCPKCSERITAPFPEPEAVAPMVSNPAVVAAVAQEQTSHRILDAVINSPEPAAKTPRPAKTKERAIAPTERDLFRSTLLDEFLSTPASPPKDETAASSLDVSELPADAFQKTGAKPLKAARPSPSPEMVKTPATHPAIHPILESETTITPAPRTLLEIISAAGLKPITPPSPPAADKASSDKPASEPISASPVTDTGLDEPVSEQSSSSTIGVIRHVLPSLGVGLMQVEDTPRHHRRVRRRRAAVAGILLFLLFDAVVFFWIFRHRISEWWNEPRTDTVTQTVTSPSSTVPPVIPPATVPVATPIETPDPSVTKSEVEPQTAVTGLIPLPESPDVAADIPTRIDASPATLLSPSSALTIGSQINDVPRVADEFARKNFGLTPIGTLANPFFTPAVKGEPTAIPDARPPGPPLNAETPAPPTSDNLTAKTEVTPPPSPPPLPSSALVPEIPDKPVSPETAPDIPPTETTDTTATSAKIIEKDITKASRPALEALKFFLAAPTWQYRLRWVQKPDTVKAAMEKHYRKYPDGPVEVARIDFIERYPAKSNTPPYCMFEVSGGELKRKILVLVEEKNKTSHLVDWEAFVEFKDQLLREFLSKPGTQSGKFRVMLRRKHYFDKDVPEIERKETFEITQPGTDTTANVFVVKGGSVSKALSQQLAWGDSIAATVQLAWHGEGERGWIELKTVPAYGWRG